MYDMEAKSTGSGARLPEFAPAPLPAVRTSSVTQLSAAWFPLCKMSTVVPVLSGYFVDSVSKHV